MRRHANRDHFRAQLYSSGAVASYPQVRGVTLTALPTHIVHSAAFGPYGTNEMLHAKQLVANVPNESLTVFDRGFLSAQILWTLTQHGTDRHFIIPAKSNTQWEVIEGDDDDCIVRMRVSPQARAKCAELPEFWEARAITIVDDQARKRVLLTSLRDRRRYGRSDIAGCYQRRWGIETSYRELKQTMLGTALTLRSKTVDGVYQEIWGTLIAYNLARLEIAKAALTVKCEPTEVSFIRAFHLIQFELHWAAVTRSYGKLPASMKHLRERLVSLLNDERPTRRRRRVVAVTVPTQKEMQAAPPLTIKSISRKRDVPRWRIKKMGSPSLSRCRTCVIRAHSPACARSNDPSGQYPRVSFMRKIISSATIHWRRRASPTQRQVAPGKYIGISVVTITRESNSKEFRDHLSPAITADDRRHF
jgi:hypothetical protein